MLKGYISRRESMGSTGKASDPKGVEKDGEQAEISEGKIYR